ncbi:hypothetical protein AB5I41_18765 [Sphingomonas sp. MMS24-JH45]
MPEDVAAAVAYFVSADAAYVNGQKINLNAGVSAPYPFVSSEVEKRRSRAGFSTALKRTRAGRYR